jgi:hypothetical protein
MTICRLLLRICLVDKFLFNLNRIPFLLLTESPWDLPVLHLSPLLDKQLVTLSSSATIVEKQMTLTTILMISMIGLLFRLIAWPLPSRSWIDQTLPVSSLSLPFLIRRILLSQRRSARREWSQDLFNQHRLVLVLHNANQFSNSHVFLSNRSTDFPSSEGFPSRLSLASSSSLTTDL